MAKTRIGEAIIQLNPDDNKAVDGLAAKIKDRSLIEPLEVVRLVHADSATIKTRASAVLLRLGTLALQPLLDSISTDNPDDYVWDMQTVVEFQLESRVRIAAILEGMLADTRLLEPPNPFMNSDESPIPTRVCDEAYFLIYTLLAFEESKENRFLNSNAFLKMDNAEKDAEIKRLLESKQWISLIEMSEAGDF